MNTEQTKFKRENTDLRLKKNRDVDSKNLHAIFLVCERRIADSRVHGELGREIHGEIT